VYAARLLPSATLERAVTPPRRRWVVRSVLLALIALALLSVFPALSLRDRVERGREMLVKAQSALVKGDAKTAVADFAQARAEFDAAAGQSGNVLIRAGGLVPFLGRTPDALLSLAEIGRNVSQAGLEVSRGLESLPLGLSSLGLSDGRIPIGALRSLGPAVHRARSLLDVADAAARRLPDSWLPGPVGDARDVVRAQLVNAVPLARAADALIRELPSLAGADGPKRYFVAAQNTAELRGTGGLIGNYAILTIANGHLSLGPFRDVWDLPTLPAVDAPSAGAEFDRLYGQFGGGGYWLNINMTPDAPTAATLIEGLYPKVTGQHLDGVIFFDLGGLADLLAATGPVRVDALGHTFTTDNVVEYVATAGYLDSHLTDPFKDGPRLVAEAVWKHFLATTEPQSALRALVQAATGGHLIVHSTDPSVQAALRLAGVAGVFGPDGSGADFFGVSLSNAAGNKVDYYLRQNLAYSVTLEPGGTVRADVSALFANTAPAGRQPSYQLGPYPGVKVGGRPLVAGEHLSWAQFLCADGCRLLTSTDGTGAFPLGAFRDAGMPAFAGVLDVKPQRTEALNLSLERPLAWEGDAAAGSYRLMLQGQPALATNATVTIRAPSGTSIVWTSVPMEVHGGMASWQGLLGSKQMFEVRFQKGLVGRAWTRVWGFLSKPVVRL
jgi:hypothetical protein